MNAKTNISKLPVSCFSVLLISGELINIFSGESGYNKLDQWYPEREIERLEITMSELADKWNAGDKVTKAQRSAMDWGSQFGWEVGLADPKNKHNLKLTE